MQLTCPHCGFSREVDSSRIPEGAVRVTCPRCRTPFPLPAEAPVGHAQADERPAVNPEPIEATGNGGESVAEVSESPSLPGLETSAVVLPDHPRAGFWIRLVAFLVDSVLVSVLEFVLTFLLLQAAALAGMPVSQEDLVIYLTLQFFNMVLTWAYFVYFTGYRGQTPGKMLLRIKVLRTDGTPVGYGRAFLREVPGKLLSGILLGIGFLMVAFHPKKQGLHDLIADTYVVKI